MQALHEHDAMEQRDVRSTPTRAALPLRRALEPQDASGPTRAHDDVFGAFTPDHPSWDVPPSEDARREDGPASERTLGAADPGPTMCSPSILARSAVLPCSVLPRNKRSGVGSHAGSGASAGPCTPPRLPCRRCAGSGSRWSSRPSPVHEVVQPREGTHACPDRTAGRTSRQAIRHLQDLTARRVVWQMRMTGAARGGAGTAGAPPRAFPPVAGVADDVRNPAVASARPWRRWREALEAAWRAQPEDPALQAASRAWTRAQGELDQAKAQMMQANLRLVIHIAHALSPPRGALARPDSGRQSGADARGGQV